MVARNLLNLSKQFHWFTENENIGGSLGIQLASQISVWNAHGAQHLNLSGKTHFVLWAKNDITQIEGGEVKAIIKKDWPRD